jgi:hypothetical protein
MPERVSAIGDDCACHQIEAGRIESAASPTASHNNDAHNRAGDGKPVVTANAFTSQPKSPH